MDSHLSRRLRPPLLTLALLLVCYLSLTYAWDRFRNTNEYSRFFLTRALVEYRTLSIDPLLRIHDTQDKSRYRGNHYSNKAPASSFLAVPAYLAVRLGEETGNFDLPDGLTLYLITALTVSIPAVLFLFLLFRFWSAFTGDIPTRRAILVLLGAGTMSWPYSTMFYSHIPAAISLMWSFILIFSRRDSSPGWRRLFGAGFLCGMAFALEYPTVLIAAGIFCYALSLPGSPSRSRRAIFFLLGTALPTGLTLYYHNLCFGGPFQFPYYHETYPAFALAHQRGIAGVSLPTGPEELRQFLIRLRRLLISPYRGIFFYSPFLVFGIIGIIKMIRQRIWRREGVLFIGLTVLYLLFLAAFSDWEGGWSMGPRHLIPLLPFLATGAVCGLANSSPKGRFPAGLILAVLGLVSLAFTFLGTVTFPYFPKEFANPLQELAWYLWNRGRLAPTIGELIGLQGRARILPAAVPVGLLAVFFLRDAARWTGGPGRSRARLIGLALPAAILLLWIGFRAGRIRENQLAPEERIRRNAQRSRVLYFMERERREDGKQ